MIAVVQREALCRALDKLVAALPTRTTLPALACVLVDADAALDAVHLDATDLDKYVGLSVEAEVAEPGVVLLPGRECREWAHEVTGAQITMETVANSIRLICERAKLELPTLAKEDYPELPDREKFAIVGEIGNDQLAALVALTGYAVASGAQAVTDPVLTGLMLQKEQGQLLLAGMDRYRLATAREAYAGDDFGRLIIPARSLAMAARVLPSVGSVQLAISDGHVWLKAPGVDVVLRRMSGAYPDYHTFFRAKGDRAAVVERARLVQALHVVRVAATGDVVGVNLTFGPTTTGTGLTVEHKNGNYAADVMECQLEGDPFSTRIRASFLLDALAPLDSEFVRVWLPKKNTQPLVVEPAATDEEEALDYAAVVMPLSEK